MSLRNQDIPQFVLIQIFFCLENFVFFFNLKKIMGSVHNL